MTRTYALSRPVANVVFRPRLFVYRLLINIPFKSGFPRPSFPPPPLPSTIATARNSVATTDRVAARSRRPLHRFGLFCFRPNRPNPRHVCFVAQRLVALPALVTTDVSKTFLSVSKIVGKKKTRLTRFVNTSTSPNIALDVSRRHQTSIVDVIVTRPPRILPRYCSHSSFLTERFFKFPRPSRSLYVETTFLIRSSRKRYTFVFVFSRQTYPSNGIFSFIRFVRILRGHI